MKRRRRLLQRDSHRREGVDEEKFAEGYARIFGRKGVPNSRTDRRIISDKLLTNGDRKLRWSDGKVEILPCPEEKRDTRKARPFPEVVDTYDVPQVTD